LEDFSGCTDSSAIACIRIEPRYGYNQTSAGRSITIRNRETIDTFYQMISNARYDCGDTYHCPKADDLTELYRKLDTSGLCGIYTEITVQFANKTILRFYCYPNADALFFSSIPWNSAGSDMSFDFVPVYPENSLHFESDDMDSLKTLLRIAE